MPRLNRIQTFLLLPPALVCAVLLFVGGPGPDSLRSVRYGWVAGHLFCFALWGYLYLSWRGQISLRRQLLEVALLCLLVGGLTEFFQSLVGREPSWQDVYHDVLGGLLAVMMLSPQRKQLSAAARLLCQLPLLLLLVWGLLPLFRAVVDDFISWQQFPLLSGFETPFEKNRWGGKSRRRIDQDVVFSGRKSLRVELIAGRYPGVFLNHFPSDWRGYNELRMHLYNPNAVTLELHLRIHDQLHRTFDNLHRDRFNTQVELAPGWNRVLVALPEVVNSPRERELDLQRVAGVGLYAVSLDHPQIIYIDEVRLLTDKEKDRHD